MGKYDDILNTKWPPENNIQHPRMPLNQRAKIFLPFAALKGYEESLEKIRQHSMEENSEIEKMWYNVDIEERDY